MDKKILKKGDSEFTGRITRRDLLKGTGLAALTGSLAGCGQTSGQAEYTPKIPIPTYESIGVTPVINCRGTYTIFSGSLMLPEARMAMVEASKRYVHMDKLMDGVGRRLSELTGAEWGIISTGCAACVVGAACACVAGADPEKMALIPDLRTMKNECIVPRNHRNVYDRAIWMAGLKMVEIETAEEMEAAVNDRTAMITSAGQSFGRGISLEDIVRIAKKHNIPTLVDAAAERPDVPNVYIEAGVDLVAYSGGKCLRGPQAAGMVLGKRDLLKAAFMNGAPHHALGRPMKAGKEEIMGLLAAVEMWVKRDHEAEWKTWEGWLEMISDSATAVESVRTRITQPGRSNVAPVMMIGWDQDVVKATPAEVKATLSEGEPRIEVFCEETEVEIMPYMMQPGDAEIVAEKLAEILKKARG